MNCVVQIEELEADNEEKTQQIAMQHSRLAEMKQSFRKLVAKLEGKVSLATRRCFVQDPIS